jgi:hypothetical protein
MYAVRTIFVERLTGFTFPASFPLFAQVKTVDGSGKNACTGGFSHSPGTTEQVGMAQVII